MNGHNVESEVLSTGMDNALSIGGTMEKYTGNIRKGSLRGIVRKKSPDNYTGDELDLFINKTNQDETVESLTNTIHHAFDIILADNSEDGTHPKATFGFDEALMEIKQTYGRGRFPIGGKPMDDVVRHFFDTYSMGINPGSPSYMGHMLPALNRIALIASTIANILNQNAIAHEVAPVFTQMENQVISFLADLIGYDPLVAGGAIVSGGTTANHTAMLVARNKLIPGIEKIGVHKALSKYNLENGTAYEDFVLFVGEDAHYSIEKLAGYIGMGSAQVKIIPFRNGSHSELDIDALQNMIDDAERSNELILGISITAGTTEKGNVHNIKDIIQAAKQRPDGKNLYVHVDAAHGGGFLTNDVIKGDYFNGIDEADSVTIDGHKMFYTNYGCGGVIFKDHESLGYIKQSAPYVLPENTNNENHGSFTIEGSRGTAGILQLWMSIMHFGKEGYSNIMQTVTQQTQILKKLLQDDGNFELLAEPELNLVCFRYIPVSVHIQDNEAINEFNTALKQKLLADGDFYLSDTEIDGKVCFRGVVMNLGTDRSHFIKLIEKLHLLSENILQDMDVSIA